MTAHIIASTLQSLPDRYSFRVVNFRYLMASVLGTPAQEKQVASRASLIAASSCSTDVPTPGVPQPKTKSSESLTPTCRPLSCKCEGTRRRQQGRSNACRERDGVNHIWRTESARGRNDRIFMDYRNHGSAFRQCRGVYRTDEFDPASTIVYAHLQATYFRRDKREGSWLT